MEEFLNVGRKLLRMVTRCNRARQNQLSLCYTEDIRFEKIDCSVFAERSTGRPVPKGEEQDRDTICNSEICKETVNWTF